jgi:hypothetical protein
LQLDFNGRHFIGFLIFGLVFWFVGWLIDQFTIGWIIAKFEYLNFNGSSVNGIFDLGKGHRGLSEEKLGADFDKVKRWARSSTF